MEYVSAFVAPVPTDGKQAYIEMATACWKLFQEFGALDWKECWGNDVPDGTLTSFPMAVKKEPGETVVFGWLIWPDQATAHACWEAMESDPRWLALFGDGMPFDGKRMIFGGFDVICQA